MRTRSPARTAVLLSAAALAASLTSVGLAAPAHADAEDCTTQTTTVPENSSPPRTRNTVTLRCTGGQGWYRVWLDCLSWSGQYQTYFRGFKYGAWVEADPTAASTATCLGFVLNSGIEYGQIE